MFPRKGLMIKDMNETQRRLAHDLLRSGLSARGYLKVTSIIELEDILKAIETGGKLARNKEEYLFSVFGTPAREGPLGLARRGASRLAALRDRRRRRRRTTSPARRCSSDRILRKSRKASKKGQRVLADEEDAARALVLALPAELQKQAIVNPVAPSDILTMNKNDITPLADQGVAYGAMGATAAGALHRN